MENKICPKCEGKMVLGNYTGTEIDWQKGEVPSFLKNNGSKINSYACEKCGYLESYVKKK